MVPLGMEIVMCEFKPNNSGHIVTSGEVNNLYLTIIVLVNVQFQFHHICSNLTEKVDNIHVEIATWKKVNDICYESVCYGWLNIFLPWAVIFCIFFEIRTKVLHDGLDTLFNTNRFTIDITQNYNNCIEETIPITFYDPQLPYCNWVDLSTNKEGFCAYKYI